MLYVYETNEEEFLFLGTLSLLGL